MKRVIAAALFATGIFLVPVSIGTAINADAVTPGSGLTVTSASAVQNQDQTVTLSVSGDGGNPGGACKLVFTTATAAQPGYSNCIPDSNGDFGASLTTAAAYTDSTISWEITDANPSNVFIGPNSTTVTPYQAPTNQLVTPTAPTVSPTTPSCASPNQTVTPSNQAGVIWAPSGVTVLNPGDSVTYTATPDAGYVFTEGAQTMFVVMNSFNAASCTPSGGGGGGQNPPTITPVCPPPPFSDVQSTSPFCQNIADLKRDGIVKGFADGTFQPGASTTREAIAAFLFRLHNPGQADPTCTTAPFNDVSVSSTFCGDITWLVSQHITKGYTDGGFHPAEAISRQGMAAFIYRDLNRGSADPTCTTAPFNDVSVNNPFCGDIANLASKGITKGYPDGGYHPAEMITREAIAAFIDRSNS